MSNTKLKEVLSGLEQERSRMKSTIIRTQQELSDIENAIQSIGKIVNGNGIYSNSLEKENQQLTLEPTRKKTNLQLAEDVLERAGETIHILKIVDEIQKIRGKLISRATIETALCRHLKLVGTESKIQRLGEGMYRIKESVVGM